MGYIQFTRDLVNWVNLFRQQKKHKIEKETKESQKDKLKSSRARVKVKGIIMSRESGNRKMVIQYYCSGSFLGLFLGSADTSRLDQRCKAGKWVTRQHERVLYTLSDQFVFTRRGITYLEQVMGRRSLFGINTKCKVQKVAEFGGEIVLILDFGRAIRGNQI